MHRDTPSVAHKISPAETSVMSGLEKAYYGLLEPGAHVGWPRKEPRDYNLQHGFTGQYVSEALQRKWQAEEDDRRRKAAAAQKLVDEDKDACRDFCPRCSRPLYRGRHCQTTNCPQYGGIYVGISEW
jgi:hypothetical protein